jgi:hypothetical protein
MAPGTFAWADWTTTSFTNLFTQLYSLIHEMYMLKGLNPGMGLNAFLLFWFESTHAGADVNKMFCNQNHKQRILVKIVLILQWHLNLSTD